jgi:integrase
MWCHVGANFLAMNTKSWPKIKAVLKNGKPMVLVDARMAGKGERRFFSTKREAEGWAQIQRVRRQNEGGRAFDDKELAVYGLTIADAIRFTVDYYRRQAASVPVDEAIRRLLESKKAAGMSEGYLRTVGNNLGKLATHFDGRMISSITPTDIESFLSGLALAPGTWNTVRRDAVTLWGYALKAGFATENAAKAAERSKEIDAPPGILTPAQAAALLAESKDNDLLAYHSIGLFAGLRVSEINALDWKDVDLAGGFIHVGAKISKTRSRRLVPILDNLKAWLQPIAKTSGVVMERKARRRHEYARARAGITVWPDNAMRHSFASYRLAQTQNAPQTALESGHDQAVLFAHYRELVKPKDAERYFSIRPVSETAEKVVSISSA